MASEPFCLLHEAHNAYQMTQNKFSIEFAGEVFQHRHVGGVSRYAFELISGIKRSYQVSVYLQLIAHRNQLLQKNATELQIRSLYYPKVSAPWFCRIAPRVDRILRRLSWRKPCLTHALYYEDSILRRATGIRIATFYDMIPETLNHASAFAAQKRRCFDHADHIISISETTKNEIVKFYGCDDSKISVIPLATRIDTVPPIQPKQLNPKDQFLLWVGSRTGYKNFRNFASAFIEALKLQGQAADLRHLKLVCTDGQLTEAEKNDIPEFSNFAERFIVISANDSELSWLYRHAVLMGYVSSMEGFGLPPLEAMACGCPVVASNAPSIVEVVGSEGCLVSPRNVSQIRDAIMKIASSPDTRNRIVQYGLERSLLFSWSRCVQETYSLYCRLVRQRA